jgi:hypothetical protein
VIFLAGADYGFVIIAMSRLSHSLTQFSTCTTSISLLPFKGYPVVSGFVGYKRDCHKVNITLTPDTCQWQG